jgi:hypothetical protein
LAISHQSSKSRPSKEKPSATLRGEELGQHSSLGGQTGTNETGAAATPLLLATPIRPIPKQTSNQLNGLRSQRSQCLGEFIQRNFLLFQCYNDGPDTRGLKLRPSKHIT